MIRRPLRPHFGPDDQKKLIEALGNARDWTIKCLSAADFHSPRMAKCEALNRCIDDLAEELTGDRKLFGLKPHGDSYTPQPPTK
jgi:hypothetical protein